MIMNPITSTLRGGFTVRLFMHPRTPLSMRAYCQFVFIMQSNPAIEMQAVRRLCQCPKVHPPPPSP